MCAIISIIEHKFYVFLVRMIDATVHPAGNGSIFPYRHRIGYTYPDRERYNYAFASIYRDSMSVLCCRIPHFLLNLAAQQQPALWRQPAVLVGADDRIYAVSPPAQRLGIHSGMPPHQAQLTCPDLLIKPLALQESQQQQDRFWEILGRWDLPVEQLGWGAAYIDLQGVAATTPTVRPLAKELGHTVRTELDLAPALGWDSGKFTARAASATTPAGHMRLIGKAGEQQFLSPLSVNLLPLTTPQTQLLKWLGVHTLGSFAHLPPAAVLQRFGQPGLLAQQWAKGRDNRPVRNMLRTPIPPFTVEYDPPVDQLQPIVETLMAALAPHLHHLQSHLEGWRRLKLQLFFDTSPSQIIDLTLLEPTCASQRIQLALTQRLQALTWHAPLARIVVTVLEQGELPAQQMALLSEWIESTPPLVALSQKLSGCHGSVFFRAQLIEPNHPVEEQRWQLQNL
jgi:nucleotidyltransferase/DNA polymerase involved in DNA repair